MDDALARIATDLPVTGAVIVSAYILGRRLDALHSILAEHARMLGTLIGQLQHSREG